MGPDNPDPNHAFRDAAQLAGFIEIHSIRRDVLEFERAQPPARVQIKLATNGRVLAFNVDGTRLQTGLGDGGPRRQVLDWFARRAVETVAPPPELTPPPPDPAPPMVVPVAAAAARPREVVDRDMVTRAEIAAAAAQAGFTRGEGRTGWDKWQCGNDTLMARVAIDGRVLEALVNGRHIRLEPGKNRRAAVLDWFRSRIEPSADQSEFDRARRHIEIQAEQAGFRRLPDDGAGPGWEKWTDGTDIMVIQLSIDGRMLQALVNGRPLEVPAASTRSAEVTGWFTGRAEGRDPSATSWTPLAAGELVRFGQDGSVDWTVGSVNHHGVGLRIDRGDQAPTTRFVARADVERGRLVRVADINDEKRQLAALRDARRIGEAADLITRYGGDEALADSVASFAEDLRARHE